jgi:hypothetical protein
MKLKLQLVFKMVTEHPVLGQLRRIKIGISKFYDVSDTGIYFHSHRFSLNLDRIIIKTMIMTGIGKLT